MKDINWSLLGSAVVTHRNRWEAAAVLYHSRYPHIERGSVRVHIEATAKAVASVEETTREAAFDEVYSGRAYEDTLTFMRHPKVVALERAKELLEECMKEWED